MKRWSSTQSWRWNNSWKLGGANAAMNVSRPLPRVGHEVTRGESLRVCISAQRKNWLVGPAEHINVLEMRAVLTALRWRFSKKGWLCTRFIHLVDLQVCLHALARGRSSSRKLRRTLLRIDSLVGITDQNPADAPSRRPVRKKWVKSSRQTLRRRVLTGGKKA